MAVSTWPFLLLIPTFILIHLFVSPHTKVEESFNIQAAHDILIHGIPGSNADQFLTANYDHMSFPGSVPRTFAGALILSGLSRPLAGFLNNASHMQLLGRNSDAENGPTMLINVQSEACWDCAMLFRSLRSVGASRKLLGRRQAYGMLYSRRASSTSSIMRLGRYRTCLLSCSVSPNHIVY